MSIKQPRFFSDNRIENDVAIIEGDEAHHLLHVMRIQIGDQVVLFDGSGQEYTANVQRVGRREVVFDIIDGTEVNRELDCQLTIAIALPKGDRQKTLVEKLVELGTTTLQPVLTTRSVAQPTDSAISRLQKQVIAASKQSGRNRLMNIAQPKSFQELLTNTDTFNKKFIADPTGQQPLTRQSLQGSSICVLIGPEGGFSNDELVMAIAAGWSPASLGPRILRVETAALVVATIFASQP